MPKALPAKPLPAKPNLEWLRKAAKHRLVELRDEQPDARLHHAQLAVARDYGFMNWRALKTHIDGITLTSHANERVFEAARNGDVEAVRRAFAAGFDPATSDVDGRTIYQIAKERRHEAIELLARDIRGGNTWSEDEVRTIRALITAAQTGDIAALRAHLDEHPQLIDALGGGFQKATALHLAVLHNQRAAIQLLVARGANLGIRDFPDNASPLHFAASRGDLETVRLLVEAGADVDGKGDDHEVGVLGWATCFRSVREDVAACLLDYGARLNLWTAIALDHVDAVHSMIARDATLLAARMTRNQHRRTALHHAAAKNRPGIVRLLIDLGADPDATDATGATPLTTASQEGADPAIVEMLIAAGATLDFLTAVNLRRYDLAEAMLAQEPARLGFDGRDTVALHLAVAKKNHDAVRWLIAHAVDVNAKRPMWDCNHAALHMTIENGDIALAQMLLDAGADPNIRDDKYDATALGWAHFFDREDFAKLLRERGANK
jgi:ankyrin repeat protein